MADYDPVRGTFAVSCPRTAGGFAPSGRIDALRARIDAMIDELKRCPTVEGVSEVLYPGELEWRREAAALAEGVELPAASEAELARAAEMAGVR